MSDFYIIGENRKIASILDASTVVSVTWSGTTYVYWHDEGRQILMSKSTDMVTWTDPVLIWAAATNYDVYPAGVVHNGSNFILVIGEINLISGAAQTYLVSSAAGTTFTLVSGVTWPEYWAAPSDLQFVGGTYYLAASVRSVFNGPVRASVRTSTNLTTWTNSLGFPGQITAVDNVWPRLSVVNAAVRLVFREGNYTIESSSDRILTAEYKNGTWSPTSVVIEGTGNPDICALDVGYAVLYQDQTIQPGQGVWAWLYFDGEDFLKRGTFSQGFEFGMGATALPTTDGFAAVYATRISDAGTAGTLYYRGFVGTIDEPPNQYVPRQFEQIPRDDLSLDNFQVEIQYGTIWYSLSDSIRYYVSADDYGDKSQVHRRTNAQSPFYEGTYLIHAVRENVTENMTIGILGVSQNQVTENMLLLEDMVSQPSFLIRFTMGDHVETWSCQTADYSLSRGHVMMHNVRAMMKLQIPRLPDVTYEVT